MANSMMRFKGRGRTRGFTLLEALISLVVLTAGLLAAYRFNSTTIAFSAESNVRAYALTMAEAKLEELRNFQDGDDFDTLVVNGADGINYASAALARTWVSEDLGVSGTLRKVDITVGWDDKLGEGQSVVLSSIIWRHNPEDGAKDLFLALNTNGNTVDAFGDSGGIVPEGHGGGEVTVEPVYQSDLSRPLVVPDDYVPVLEGVYDVSFEGDILFVDEGLQSVLITMDQYLTYTDENGNEVVTTTLNHQTSSSCVAVPEQLHYTCSILGIPDGDSWSGSLVFVAAGNDEVCEPTSQTIGLEPINQGSTVIDGLQVVVMNNFSGCM